MTGDTNGDGTSLASAVAETRSLSAARHWYAVYTRSRCEKRVAAHCLRKEVESFLPLYETVRTWKNGRHRVRLPLFPGYMFVRFAPETKLKVLSIPGVVRMVGFNGSATHIPDQEIEQLRGAMETNARMKPHPFLEVGKTVRIKTGPLTGLNGRIVRKKSGFWFVVALSFIRQAASVEIPASELEALWHVDAANH